MAPNGPDLTGAAREQLRHHAMRVTPQRVTVLAALMAAQHDDTTAQALHERLRSSHPTIGLATVYRTLAALADAGIVDSIQHGHGTCWRHCAPGHHHHLTCVRCHRVVEVRDCAIGEWAERVGEANGFHEVTHAVELSGVCDRCAA